MLKEARNLKGNLDPLKGMLNGFLVGVAGGDVRRSGNVAFLAEYRDPVIGHDAHSTATQAGARPVSQPPMPDQRSRR